MHLPKQGSLWSIFTTIKGDCFRLPVSFYSTKMSRQVISRDILILGDSNVRRYLGRCGGAYTQACDCGLARNLSEFGSSLKMIDATNYRIVIFAMMTNILIDAGSEGHDHQSRTLAMDECLSPLIENLRLEFSSTINVVFTNCKFWLT
jgi:hypothetical protein